MTEASTSSTNKMTSSSIDPELLWTKMTAPHLARHGIGEDKHTSYKLTEKVDRHGNYLEFPNLTVVHSLGSKKLASLPLRLQQVAGVYVSPLPSYHATLLCGPLHIDLNGPQQQQDNLFAACLQEPCWERMASYLASKKYVPSSLVVNDVVCKPSGGITVYLQGNNHGEEAARILRDELRQIGVCHNLRNALEELAAHKDLGKKARQTAARLLTSYMEPKDRGWHITIAYPRKSASMPKEVQEQVRALVRDAFQTESNDGILSFEPAQLCLSPNMTTFVPWNGRLPFTVDVSEDENE